MTFKLKGADARWVKIQNNRNVFQTTKSDAQNVNSAIQFLSVQTKLKT